MRFVQSPHYSSRNNKSVDLVVIHTTVGYYEGTINYFKSNDLKVSSHYVVKEDGMEVCQMVDEAYAAHHAGIVSNPSPLYYRGFNPNWHSIGIENADNKNPQSHNREGQYKALAILVRDICKRHNIPIDRNHICGHRELYDKKTCPGNLDIDRIVKEAKEGDFDMDDDTKRALEQVDLAKNTYAFGNREGTVRGLVGWAVDLVNLRNDFEAYKNGEPIRIKEAVDKAIAENDKNWQSQLDTANKNIENLTLRVDLLTTTQAENLPWKELFSIAWKKWWGAKKAGDLQK